MPPGAESGSSVLAVSLLMLLFSAIAFGAAIVVQIEVMIADHFRQTMTAGYAAEAGAAAAIGELRGLAVWSPIVQGLQHSPLADGTFGGSKPLPGGGVVVLCCGTASASDRLAQESRLAVTPARRVLAWRPYLWIPFDRLVSGDGPTGLYVVVWVAGSEADEGGDRPAVEAVLIRAEAMDRGGVRRMVEVLIERGEGRAVGLLSWREVR
jgi:hypothetical protein